MKHIHILLSTHIMSDSNIEDPLWESRAAERAAQEVIQFLQGKSKDEVLQYAKDFQEKYSKVLQVRYAVNKVSVWQFFDMLGDSFPEAAHDKKMILANKIADLVKSEFGAPEDVPQSELLVASSKTDAAVSELAKKLTDIEVTALDRTARDIIRKLPENYEDFKSEWLAEWIAKGTLKYPV